MSEIISVRCIHIRHKLSEPEHLIWSGGIVKQRDYIFIKIKTKDKKIGWGEIGEVYFYPEIYSNVINKKVRDFLLGKNGTKIREIHRDLHVFLISLGYSGMAKAIISGIDIALYNLNTRVKDCRTEVPVYASTGFNHNLDKMCEECQKAVDVGFKNIKIRGGISVNEDIKRIKTARKYLGKSIGLILELSQPYSYSPYTFSEIVKICRGVQKYDVLWVEEPFYPEDFGSYERLKNRSLIKIGCGENLYTEEQFRTFGEIIDICQPDVTRMGGITSLRKISRYCKRIALHQFGTSVALYTLCKNVDKIKNFYMLELDLIENPVRNVIFGNKFNILNGNLIVKDFDISRLDNVLSMYSGSTTTGKIKHLGEK